MMVRIRIDFDLTFAFFVFSPLLFLLKYPALAIWKFNEWDERGASAAVILHLNESAGCLRCQVEKSSIQNTYIILLSQKMHHEEDPIFPVYFSCSSFLIPRISYFG